MTVDLRDQLHELCAFIDDEQGPIAVDHVRARNDEAMLVGRPTRRTRPTFSGRRRWLVAAAAAALVVAASLPLLVFTGNNEPEGFSGSTEPDVATSPTFAPSSSGWSRVPYDEAVFGGAQMNSVTVGGPGLVAVGSVESEGDGSGAAVWTSVDGITWSRVPGDETVFGGEGAPLMFDVTVGGPGLVAVGSVLIDGWDDTDAAVWTSVDGFTWSRVPHDEALFGGANMSSVTVGGPGLVAVGEADSGDDFDAAVWTSVDGLTWSRVPLDEAVFGGADDQMMIDVTVGGPGLVAVGKDGSGPWDNSGDQVAAVWTSVDGISWSRVPHDEEVFGEANDQVMISVTGGGPGMVAVGWAGGYGNAAVWTSVDGLTWSRVPHDEEVFGGARGPAMAVDVTAAGPGLVAVGEGVWTSVDGLSWSRVPDDEADAGTKWGVIAAGPGLVAVGDIGSNAAVWVTVTED